MLEILLEEYKKTQSDPSTGAKEKIASAMAGAQQYLTGRFFLKVKWRICSIRFFHVNHPIIHPKESPSSIF